MRVFAEPLDIILARMGPDPDDESSGLDDVRALWKYVIEVFLEIRRVPVDARIRRRVLATRDASRLRRGLARALTVTSAEPLFDPRPA